MIMDGACICIMSLFFLLLLIAIGTPLGSNAIHNNLLKIGFTNKAGEPPRLLAKYRDVHMKKSTIYEFDSPGISILDWDKKIDRIASALNVHITTLDYGRNIQKILLRTIPANKQLPNFLEWQNALISTKDFELVIGESLVGIEKINLSVSPHILIGGGMGSGKSVLLKCLVMQCIKKGAEVHIADFKGGVDFSRVWHEKCNIIMEQKVLLVCLKEIAVELEHRKEILRTAECANIETYNNKQDLKRIIFVCDEITEILNKTGLSKEEKEMILQIENLLSLFARQGRAFGIHLLLSTQRPDANILSGQIKNNINFRICGNADKVLSEIILDNMDAVKKVPKNSKGRFVTNEGTVFQGYYINDNDIF